MDSLSHWQLVIGVVLAAAVSALNRRTLKAPGIVGLLVAIGGVAANFATPAPDWAPWLACLGIGLGLSPLLALSDADSGKEQSALVPGFLLILCCSIVCGSIEAGDAFFMKAALFSSGLSLGALLLGYGTLGGGIALACLVLGAADTLGRSQLTNPQTPPGLALAAALAASLLITSSLRSLIPSQAKVTALGIALAAALFYFAANRLLTLDSVAFAGLAGAIAAALVVWALPSHEESETTQLIGAIVMVGLGTAAFAEGRGLGMATAALAALTVGLLSGRPKMMGVISPLAILAVYRAFGIVYPEAAKALDIGQHYGIIGLMAGVLLASVMASWAETSRFPANLLGWLAGALVCGFAPLVIGAKGAVGLLVGLGLVGALGRRNSLAGGMSFAGLSLLGFGLLQDRLDLTREERLPMLGWVALGALVFFIAALLLGRQKREEVA